MTLISTLYLSESILGCLSCAAALFPAWRHKSSRGISRYFVFFLLASSMLGYSGRIGIQMALYVAQNLLYIALAYTVTIKFRAAQPKTMRYSQLISIFAVAVVDFVILAFTDGLALAIPCLSVSASTLAVVFQSQHSRYDPRPDALSPLFRALFLSDRVLQFAMHMYVCFHVDGLPMWSVFTAGAFGALVTFDFMFYLVYPHHSDEELLPH